MGRPSVRHCSDCPYFKRSDSTRHTYCCYGVLRVWEGRWISYQEARNSPLWCPLGRVISRRKVVG